MTPELVSQFTAAAVVVYALQFLKKLRWIPWIDHSTVKVNRVLGMLAGVASAIGIHSVYDAHAGSLLITGLTLTGIAHGVWHALTSCAFQQVIYDVAASPAAAASRPIEGIVIPGYPSSLPVDPGFPSSLPVGPGFNSHSANR